MRAVVWWRTGDKVKATVWASRVFGWICIVGGLYVFFLTRNWTSLWFSLIGWFVAGSATAEAQQAVLAAAVQGQRDPCGHLGHVSTLPSPGAAARGLKGCPPCG